MIQLSPAAIAEVKRIQSKHPAPVRLGVEKGGCAALYYTLALVEQVTPEDTIVECEGVQIAIAPEHQPYLNGLSLDYTQDLMGGGFRFNNPNAVSSCGCGNSFAVGNDQPSYTNFSI
jgi:iron-sulfur cluster assembly protein